MIYNINNVISINLFFFVTAASNHIKVVAITFGVLFFILFLALIGFIMICVWGKRKNKKSPTVGNVLSHTILLAYSF